MSERRVMWQAVGLMGLTVLTYVAALRGEFIWDDDDHVTRNAAVQSAGGLKEIWSNLEVGRYYPLTLTTFWLEHKLWGLHPLPYHAVNIVLHAVNAVLLFLVLRKHSVMGAWGAAALWAIHPVNVESVAWVTELKNVQSGLFFLLALWLWPKRYACALICGAAAMLSKPSTVVLPGVLLLLARWRREEPWRDVWLRTLPLFGMAFAMSLVAVLEQRGHIERAASTEWALRGAERLMLAGQSLWFYVIKFLVPVKLMFVYPRWELETWWPVLGVIAIAVVVVWRRMQGLACGLGCFAIALAPVLGFFDVYFFRYSFVADHFQYLASMALAATFAALVRARPWVISPAIVICLGLAMGRVLVFQNDERLWVDTLRKNPSCWMAHNNLGTIYWDRGERERALHHFEEALRLDPNSTEVRLNLGSHWLASGEAERAVEPFRQAVQARPQFADAHQLLADALAAEGHRVEAEQQYKEALRLSPESPATHFNYAQMLEAHGHLREAVVHYRFAAQYQPADISAHFNLANCLLQLGDTTAAIAEYRSALVHAPERADIRNNLAIALRASGQIGEAVKEYQTALALARRQGKVDLAAGIERELAALSRP